MWRSCSFRTPLLLLSLIVTPCLLASTIVVPLGFDSAEGNSGQSTAVQSAPRTLQTVLAASQVVGIVPGSQIFGVAYRLDGGAATWPGADRSWTNYDILLSTSLYGPGSLSSSFADNIGPDAVTVRSGPLTIPASSFPGGSTPNAFGFLFSFTAPYTYPGGDLLITVRHTGNGVDPEYLDSETGGTGSLYQSIAADSYGASTANLSLLSTRIMALDVTGAAAIPEPASYWLVGLGLLALPVFRHRRR